MSKNADTMALGGNRFDCGPKVIKKTGLDKNTATTELFIKTNHCEDAYIKGFEKSLEKINFN